MNKTFIGFLGLGLVLSSMMAKAEDQDINTLKIDSSRMCFRCANTRKELVQEVWSQLKDGVERENLEKLYSEEVVYEDFVKKVRGLDELTEYWSELYKKYKFIYFRYDHSDSKDNKLYVHWTMMAETHATAEKPSVKLMSKGISVIKFIPRTTLVVSQRDYMDMPKPVADWD